MTDVVYGQEPALSVHEFVAVLKSSGLAARRPVDDLARIEKMLNNADLVMTARRSGRLVGVSRALTDFAYACYLSDLAVDRSCQGLGIGRRLIEETRRAAGAESLCLLLSSPDAMPFYRAVGMTQPDNAFLFKRER